MLLSFLFSCYLSNPFINFPNRNGAEGSKPTAHGVVFRDSLGRRHKAYLKPDPRNEIIVSAGALGSPQLLMLSGIGPEEHLKAHNIRITLDQPLVGQGMSDNPMNAIFVPSPVPVEISLIEVVGITTFGTYIEAASGENFAGGSPKDYGMFSPKVFTPLCCIYNETRMILINITTSNLDEIIHGVI